MRRITHSTSAHRWAAAQRYARMLLLPDYRGHGLGERLLNVTVEACRGKWERVELSVYSHNERAHKLYLRCGFVEEGRRRNAWKLDGVTSDIIDMALYL